MLGYLFLRSILLIFSVIHFNILKGSFFIILLSFKRYILIFLIKKWIFVKSKLFVLFLLKMRVFLKISACFMNIRVREQRFHLIDFVHTL